MDDICISKSRETVSDVSFYFAGIPMKTMSKEITVRSPGFRQCGKPSRDLQYNRNPDMGIQQADRRLLENLFGTAVAEQCRCYHKTNLKQRSSCRLSKSSRTLNEGYLCSPNKDVVERRDNVCKETIHTLPCYDTKQDKIGSCFIGGYHSVANSTTLCTQEKDGTNQPMVRPYEKLNKQTMETQLDSNRIAEFDEINDFSNQFFPFMAMLQSQKKCLDIISQRMFAMAMHQYNFSIKSNYMTPKCASTRDENEMSRDPNNYHHNRYPAKMNKGLSHQGFSEYPDRNKERCGCSERGIGGDDVLVDAARNYSLETWEKQHCFPPDADVDLSEDSDEYLPPRINTVAPVSPNHGPEVGVDSFGLPLTTFECEAKYEAN